MQPPLPPDEFENGMKFIRRTARRFSFRFGRNVDSADLRQAGVVGLLEAWARFDASRGVPFGAYASRRVRGAMLDSIVKGSGLSRHELAMWRETYLLVGRPIVGVADEQALAEAHMGLQGGAARPCDVVWARQRRAFLLDAIQELPQIERDALACKFLGAGTLSDFAELHGRSRSWASRVLRSALDSLRALLTPSLLEYSGAGGAGCPIPRPRVDIGDEPLARSAWVGRAGGPAAAMAGASSARPRRLNVPRCGDRRRGSPPRILAARARTAPQISPASRSASPT